MKIAANVWAKYCVILQLSEVNLNPADIHDWDSWFSPNYPSVSCHWYYRYTYMNVLGTMYRIASVRSPIEINMNLNRKRWTFNLYIDRMPNMWRHEFEYSWPKKAYMHVFLQHVALQNYNNQKLLNDDHKIQHQNVTCFYWRHTVESWPWTLLA